MTGLQNHSRASPQHWNKIPDSVRELVVDVALEQPELAIACEGGEASYASAEEGFGEGSLQLTRLTILNSLVCA